MCDEEHTHTWSEWQGRLAWPLDPGDERPAVRTWMRECECGAAQYVRIEGDEQPDESHGAQGMHFP